jgi:hypothetical protein
VWHPALDSPWQWMIDHPLDLADPKDMGLADAAGVPLVAPAPVVYDIDADDNSASTVATLHTQGKHVICYVDVGTWENWRPDAASFPGFVLGSGNGWPGERWLDIRQLGVLGPIMRARLEGCRAKGFDAVEPDNVDGYSNATGFPLTAADQLAYDEFIAATAHALGLAVGLKNDVDQAIQLAPQFDFAVDEQCFQYHECDALRTAFVDAGKAVFEAEYSLAPKAFCPSAARLGFNAASFPTALDGGRSPCP